MDLTNNKCLIAYFSRKGQNYVSGKIVDLRVGNTEAVANMIQKITGGDMFHIESVIAYPKDAGYESAFRRSGVMGKCMVVASVERHSVMSIRI